MYVGRDPLLPKSPLSDVIRPGSPRWLVLPGFAAGLALIAAVVFATLMAVAFAVRYAVDDAAMAAIGATAILAAPFVPVAYLGWRHRNDRLVPFGPAVAVRFEGIEISDAGLTMLVDIKQRFDYARRLVGEVPTGIDWRAVQDDVSKVMWDAAEHAARVSQLDRELVDMAYAEAGTPQAVLKRRLEERRDEHWHVLLDEQREADDLARQAGNAAAAAKVALARTGSMRALEVAAPSPQAALARRSLREVRDRLALLADVWAELDESTDLLAEKLLPPAADRQQDPSAS